MVSIEKCYKCCVVVFLWLAFPTLDPVIPAITDVPFLAIFVGHDTIGRNTVDADEEPLRDRCAVN